MKGEAPEDLDASDMLRGTPSSSFSPTGCSLVRPDAARRPLRHLPGADMLAGVETAERLGLGVALVDRGDTDHCPAILGATDAQGKAGVSGESAGRVRRPASRRDRAGMAIGLVVGVAAESIAGPVLPAGAWAGGTLPTIPLLGGLAIAAADFLIIALGIGLVVGIPIAVLLTSLGGDEDLEEFDMSDLTDGDVVTAMMEEFRRFSPGGAEALIDERDALHRPPTRRAPGGGLRRRRGRRCGPPGGHRTLPRRPGLVTGDGVARRPGGKWSILRLQADRIRHHARVPGLLRPARTRRGKPAMAARTVRRVVRRERCMRWRTGTRRGRAMDERGRRRRHRLDDERQPAARTRLVRRLRRTQVPGRQCRRHRDPQRDPRRPGVTDTGTGRPDARGAPLSSHHGRRPDERRQYDREPDRLPAILPWLSAPIGGVEAMGGLLVEGARTGADVVWSAVGG